MRGFFKNYNKFIIPLLIIYLVTNIVKSIFNIYFFLILLVITLFVYKNNKILFKKILYKTFLKSLLLVLYINIINPSKINKK